MSGMSLTSSGATSTIRVRRKFTWVAAVLALATMAVGLPSSSAHASGSTIMIADVAPFTGVDAALGPIYLVSCYAATQAINNAGGVSGHKLGCTSADTRGDPADAVPAVRKLIATTSNLDLVIGCTSDEAATVVPILNANKTVSFCMTGQSEFDHVKFPYFFRLVPPDLEEAYAMVAIAKAKGYKKIALAFGNDIGSQAFVQPAIAAIHKAGMKLVANETLQLSATTFQTEAQAIVAAKPQVVLTEALGPADASLLGEMKQLNGGKFIPTIGTSATIGSAWFSTVSQAVGAKNIVQHFVADNQSINAAGAAYRTYAKLILAQKGKVSSIGDYTTLLTAPGAVHLYDGINLAALAMVMSKSTKGSVFKADILKIANGVPGAKVVSSFAQGLALLKKHEAVHYVGVGGPTSFDGYHTSVGSFQIDAYNANGSVKVVGNVTQKQITALS